MLKNIEQSQKIAKSVKNPKISKLRIKICTSTEKSVMLVTLISTPPFPAPELWWHMYDGIYKEDRIQLTSSCFLFSFTFTLSSRRSSPRRSFGFFLQACSSHRRWSRLLRPFPCFSLLFFCFSLSLSLSLFCASRQTVRGRRYLEDP